ncbi:4a-hydroxytetrahydrobiopterin dehydratase [Aliiroseovarius subalbicans]|uniref:4a-hydroxytetrahydrobiopterin dehydratase n=1 Tax=Aliiroseovarius subalbicans TaxID=2925840 RepID=UPI001F5874DB|nr:4a-hydroxytetrahydrobiopterin dehydratase [Aliiroseovarius subalbicans]MCI2398717.1 4a-hydroxytetrahydrobiopterin dehydratase [Aliiroseovarius subalbicans]
MERLSDKNVQVRLATLDGWHLDDGKLVKRLQFKGFAKATYHANLAAYLGDQVGHHPDIAFGWGYCQVTFTTHDAGGLTVQDFDCANKFDAMCGIA